MVSFRSLLITAVSLAVAVAQVNIAFTSVPAVVVPGNQYNITWGGGDGTAVTLYLRKGNPANLQTIGIIGSGISGNYYVWTPDSSLATASDYALQISQGVSGINYSGPFALVGGTGTSSISYSGATTASVPPNGTVVLSGSTMVRTTDSTASMGTGTAMPRNTTFSAATLTSSGRTISTGTATSTTRTTATISQSTSAPSGNAGTTFGSSAALVMGLFGAIMFLN